MSMSLFTEFPECNGAGSSNVQGIHAVRHRDFYGIVALCNGFGGETIALGAEDDCQFFGRSQARVIDGNGVISERHCDSQKTVFA